MRAGVLRVGVGLVGALLALGAGCSRPGWVRAPSLPDVDLPVVTLPDLGGGGPEEGRVSEVEVVESPEVADFYGHASGFYQRLEGRRFNSVAAFRDDGLRAYFASEEAFVDYYSALADELASAHFERSAPLSAEVREFLVDGPGRARVRVRIVGRDGRPLRFWSASVDREDQWERRGGRWWIVPATG